jgi:hypothetical protein
LFDGLDRRLNDKKCINDIAAELCPGVSKGRDKVIRIIKMHRGGKYLIDNHEWLGYNADRIRNPTGKKTYNNEPKKSEMLFKPSLSTCEPTTDEYNKWRDSLTDIVNILTELDSRIVTTTEGRHRWKINELKKRVIELRELLKTSNSDNSECSTDLCSDTTTKRERAPRLSTVELHRTIFDKAVEQINLVGKVNGNKIAKELNINAPNVYNHLKKMNGELEELKRNWQEERDKNMVNNVTRDSEQT